MQTDSVSYAGLRKELALSNELYFNISYGTDGMEKAEKKKLGHMRFYHKLCKALNKVEKGAIDKLTWEQRDEIARILLIYKSDEKRATGLRNAGIPESYIPALLELSTAKAVHLSCKALKKIIPYLEQGNTYDEACTQVYGPHYGRHAGNEKKRKLKLSDAEEINNPVVRRAIAQTIQLVNAIVREYGPPEIVRIELAREMGKPFEVRCDIQKKQNDNAKNNEKLKETIKEYKSGEPTGLDIVKFRLFQEQDGICLYSEQNLAISRLFDAGYVDVDHIIPYSISFDDSYNNKVLVLASENRQKGNRIPYEYFGNNAGRWHLFEVLVNKQIKSWKKRQNLLAMTVPEQDGFKRRNLTDTQYIARVMYNLINDHLEFADTNIDKKKRTETINGAVTAYIRKRLGIEKIRENGDLHHAADAAVIACISPGMINKITRYSKFMESVRRTKDGYLDMSTGELMTKEEYDRKYSPRFPAPWERFREELEARLSDDPMTAIARLKLAAYDEDFDIAPVFVSRMPKHKVTGAAHKETIRSSKMNGHTVIKTPLADLKLDKKTGEIKGYFNPQDDMLLYNALKKRLAEYDGDGKKAFAEPFYKPKSDGTPGPLVKKVKTYEKSTLSVEVCGGVADNSSMIRVDVFFVEGDGYYFVPIYTADTVKDVLPNKAVVAGKPYDEWKEMRDEDFLFSIYSNDLIYVENKDVIKLSINKQAKQNRELANSESQIVRQSGLFYYKSLDISNGSIRIETNDRKYYKKSLGVKTLPVLKKYQVDILGNYSEVMLPEKRMGF